MGERQAPISERSKITIGLAVIAAAAIAFIAEDHADIQQLKQDRAEMRGDIKEILNKVNFIIVRTNGSATTIQPSEAK